MRGNRVYILRGCKITIHEIIARNHFLARILKECRYSLFTCEQENHDKHNEGISKV